MRSRETVTVAYVGPLPESDESCGHVCETHGCHDDSTHEVGFGTRDGAWFVCAAHAALALAHGPRLVGNHRLTEQGD
jgi:hypothetical protein